MKRPKKLTVPVVVSAIIWDPIEYLPSRGFQYVAHWSYDPFFSMLCCLQAERLAI